MAKQPQRSRPVSTPFSTVQNILSSAQDGNPQAKKRRGRPPKQPVAESNSDEKTSALSPAPLAEELAPDDPPKRHGYSTRATNKRHPAEAVGLRKRTQGEVSVRANDKKTAKNAITAEKLKQTEAQKQHEADGAKRLAALEDQRMLDDQRMADDDYVVFDYKPTQREGSGYWDEPWVRFVDGEMVKIDKEEFKKKHKMDEYAESDSHTELSQPDDFVPKLAPKLSAAEKKAVRKNEILSSIQSAREVPQTTALSSKKRKLNDESLLTNSKKPKKAEDAFKPNWRENLQSANSYGPSLASTSIPSGSAQRRLQTAHKRNGAENIGGLGDDDVAIKRESVINSSKVQLKQMVEIIEVDDNSGDGKKPARRQPKTSVAPERSLAFDVLPDWVKPHFDTKLVPTVLHVYGAEDNPWDLDHGEEYFATVVQTALDTICPRQHHQIEDRSDRIYAIVRQRVYEWRTAFQKAANKVVGATIVEQFGKKHDTKKVKDAVKAFAINAISDGGAAFWGRPSRNPKDARDALQSLYVLKTFASHLQAISGSVSDNSMSAHPCGALALSVAAVQRAFMFFQTGQFKAAGDFSELNAGSLTREYREGSVEGLMLKPHRFKAFIKMAEQVVETPKQNRVSAGRAHLVIDPSSPAPSDDEA
ncbi:hypothetical protein BD410DRAFT_841927 [Rickenella mellea]|uniref:Uncharacterized protein n=1 Tax=Rickenella mellea TaxID=50990 RepID=A0A4Y7PY83_9AGAM|nr:hypothetical protein BD410DRAFT_841927 [Rickenella mellea]